MKGKGKNAEGQLITVPYLLVAAANLLVTFGYSMTSTLITSYAVNLGAALGAAGALGGIYSIAALVSRPAGGVITDKWDKKRVCLFTALVMGIVMMGYMLVRAVPALFFFRIVNGAAFGIYSTVSMAFVSTFIPRKRLGEGLGYFGLTQVLAQICGPSLGGAVKERFGFSVLFVSVSLITLGACILLLGVKRNKETAPSGDLSSEAHRCGGTDANEKAPRENPRGIRRIIAFECMIFAITGGMFSLSNGIMNSFLVLLGEERGISGVSTFFLVNGLVLFVIRMVIGKTIDKRPLTVIVDLSLIFIIVSMILAGRAEALGMLLLAAVLKAVGQGGGQISLQSACIKKVDPERVGIATSTYYIGADIGQGLGPMLGGRLADNLGYEKMFYIMAVIIAVVMVIFNCYQRKGEGDVKENIC